MNLNSYFKKSEFACKCGCGFDDIDERLVWIATSVREHFESPVVITSGCRCKNHNKNVGGAPTSQHVLGRAIDIQVKGVAPSEVQRYLDRVLAGRHGLGYAKTFTHVDVRANPARFNY